MGAIDMQYDTQHPSRAMAVANWFLERSWSDPSKPHCDQMKLYKLVFYAHAWYVGNCRRELFPEDVKAWPHGPVVPDLYGSFNSFRSGPITRLGQRLEVVENAAQFVTPKHDGTLTQFFESIWDNYGDKTGIELSNMTHLKGEPWTIVAEQYGFDLSCKPTIPTEIIESVFVEKVAHATQAQAVAG